MVEHMIKTIKHRFMVMVVTNIQDWDSLLPQIFFGYWCGIQANMKYSFFMVFIGCKPRLHHNNFSGLCDVFDEHASPKIRLNDFKNVVDCKCAQIFA